MKYIAFDTETTGIEPGSRILEIAAITFDKNGIIEKNCQLINPGMPIPPDVTKINGITDDMVKDAPTADKVLPMFFEVMESNFLIAHNAAFDTGMVSYEAGKAGMPIPGNLIVIDTCAMAKFLGETKNNKLVTLADHHGLVRMGDDHRAMNDADLCRQYFLYALEKMPQDGAVPWANAGHEYSFPDVLPPAVESLPGLVSAGEPFGFKYQDAKGDVTERTITPYGYAWIDGTVMFHGLCHLRQARRTFRADRIITE